MSGDFYCTRKGGIKIDENLTILEGTNQKGPWYPVYQFSDEQLEKWRARGWIAMREAK
jgi:hypothetical protein